jgi:hypothetical protein
MLFTIDVRGTDDAKNNKGSLLIVRKLLNPSEVKFME